MSSEIEVVDEIQSPAPTTEVTSTSANGTVIEDDHLRNDVYTAAAYGDMEKLQRLVETEGCSVSQPDGLGYYALQWASLNNRPVAAQYILEHGGDVNVADHTGQTALHWSSVTAFVAPLYWDIYAPKGLNSARICFTCHNFEYQGTAPASELALCGLDVSHLNRPDRMQDHSAHDRINPLKDRGFEDAKPVIAALKSQGITTVGAAGFCWGAKVVVELTKSPHIQAAVLLHPSSSKVVVKVVM